MLMIGQNTGSPKKIGGRRPKDRNLVSAAALDTTPMDVDVFVGTGGEKQLETNLRRMLSTGRYDNLVRERMDEMENGSAEAASNLRRRIYDAKDIPCLQNMFGNT